MAVTFRNIHFEWWQNFQFIEIVRLLISSWSAILSCMRVGPYSTRKIKKTKMGVTCVYI